MEQQRKVEYRLKVLNDRYPDGNTVGVMDSQDKAIADAKLWQDHGATAWVEETVTLTAIYTRQVWSSKDSQ